MKLTVNVLTACIVLVLSFSGSATEFKTVNYGAASVVYDYQQASDEVATLSLNALVTETNDSLRGLKNSDRRRLGKMGQLIYQCKLLLRTSAKSASDTSPNTPMLVSRNYSLFTDVDLPLAAGKRLGIKVRSLQPVDGNSLFSPTLGQQNVQSEVWANLGEGSSINLKHLDVNVLQETDVINTAENIDIIVRFPIFQMQEAVNQWSYNFNVKDFRQAVRHADENCTLEKLAELIDRKG